MVKGFIKKEIKKTGTYKVLEIDNNNLKKRTEDLKKQNKNLEYQINSLIVQKDGLIDEKKDLRNRYNYQKDQNQKLRDKGTNLENQLNNLIIQKDGLIDEKKELENLNNNQKNENQKLINESENLENQLNDLIVQKDILSNEKKDLEDRYNHQKSQNQKFNNEKKNLENRYNYQKDQNQKLNDEIKNLENRLNYQKKQNTKIKDELNHQKGLNNHHKKVKRNYISLVNNLMAENKAIKEKYEDNIEPSSDYDKLTTIIPYCKTEDPVREENLDITLNYLAKIGMKKVIISEHSDVSSKEYLLDKYEDLFDSFRLIFSKADDKLFNKSHAINRGVIASDTPYFVINDMDCLTPKKNIDLAIGLLDRGFEVVHPFNRVVKDIRDKENFVKDYDFEIIQESPQYRNWADGGMVFWNKRAFINIGMNNEYFVNWGGEDNEVIIRATLFELKSYRINDILYHLYHDRPLIMSKNNDELLEKTKKMNKEILLKEIDKWPWLVEALNSINE